MNESKLKLEDEDVFENCFQTLHASHPSKEKWIYHKLHLTNIKIHLILNQFLQHSDALSLSQRHARESERLSKC